MAVTLSQFVQWTIDSGLLTAEAVAAIREQSAASDAEGLARALVQREKLTPFQAQQIYAGKGASLVLGNYLVLDKLGQGGMGMVLKATHRRMKRTVALKVLSPTLTKTPELAARFQREVEAAARLSHPNIVAAHDADVANDTLFLVMEYVAGRDLSTVVKSQGPLSPELAVSCILQTARGLEYAHRHGVIHRDIKPANLLLDDAGTVKILDMGLARIEGETGAQAELTSTGAVMGTVDYMAPEQALNTKSADARSDIYSLGVTLWYLLIGRPLYQGDSLMARLIAHREFPVPSLIDALSPESPGVAIPGLLPALNVVLQKMLAKSPADRYQSMTDVIAALESLLQNGHEQAPATLPDDSQLRAFLSSHSSGPTAVSHGTAAATAAEPMMEVMLQPTFTAASAAERTATRLPETDLHATRMTAHRGKSVATPVWHRDRRWQLAVAVLVVLAGVIGFWPRGPQPPEHSADTAVAPLPLPGSSDPDQQHRNIREMLDWVRKAGGTATLLAHGERIEVDRITAPPVPPFTVTDINLENAFSVSADDLARLGCLPEEFQLVLPTHLTDAEAGAAVRQLPNVATVIARNVNNTFTATFAEGLGEHPLRYLILSWRVPQPGSLAALARLPRLENILLQRCQVTPAVLAEVARLPHLKSLNLEASNITDEYLTALTLPHHCHLALYGTAVTTAGAKAFLIRNPGCNVGALAPEAQAEVDEWLASRGGGPATNAMESRPGAGYALEFDGVDDEVRLDPVKLTGRQLTVEAWVTLMQEPRADISLEVLQFGDASLGINSLQRGADWRLTMVTSNQKFEGVSFSRSAGERDRRTHLAAVIDDERCLLFVDGKLAGSRSTAEVLGDTGPFWEQVSTGTWSIGSAQLSLAGRRRFVACRVDEYRVSSNTRYTEAFTLADRFTADENTLVLYHFDEGDGDNLHDASGRGHDSQIGGARWVSITPARP
jgi:serine/threonine protein kinase